MSNIEKLTQVFSECLKIPSEFINDQLEYQTAREWDSVAHMVLIAKIEETFDLMLETDDILNMSSFKVARDILVSKGIEL